MLSQRPRAFGSLTSPKAYIEEQSVPRGTDVLMDPTSCLAIARAANCYKYWPSVLNGSSF